MGMSGQRQARERGRGRGERMGDCGISLSFPSSDACMERTISRVSEVLWSVWLVLHPLSSSPPPPSFFHSAFSLSLFLPLCLPSSDLPLLPPHWLEREGLKYRIISYILLFFFLSFFHSFFLFRRIMVHAASLKRKEETIMMDCNATGGGGLQLTPKPLPTLQGYVV